MYKNLKWLNEKCEVCAGFLSEWSINRQTNYKIIVIIKKVTYFSGDDMMRKLNGRFIWADGFLYLPIYTATFFSSLQHLHPFQNPHKKHWSLFAFKRVNVFCTKTPSLFSFSVKGKTLVDFWGGSVLRNERTAWLKGDRNLLLMPNIIYLFIFQNELEYFPSDSIHSLLIKQTRPEIQSASEREISLRRLSLDKMRIFLSASFQCECRLL